MSAKELFIDFLNLIFAIGIIGLTFLYVLAGNGFETFKTIMQSLAPFGIFGMLLLISLRLKRGREKKRRSEGAQHSEITFGAGDRIKLDIFAFSLPIVVCLTAWLTQGRVRASDFLEACAVFILAYCFRWWILSKQDI